MHLDNIKKGGKTSLYILGVPYSGNVHKSKVANVDNKFATFTYCDQCFIQIEYLNKFCIWNVIAPNASYDLVINIVAGQDPGLNISFTANKNTLYLSGTAGGSYNFSVLGTAGIKYFSD